MGTDGEVDRSGQAKGPVGCPDRIEGRARAWQLVRTCSCPIGVRARRRRCVAARERKACEGLPIRFSIGRPPPTECDLAGTPPRLPLPGTTRATRTQVLGLHGPLGLAHRFGAREAHVERQGTTGISQNVLHSAHCPQAVRRAPSSRLWTVPHGAREPDETGAGSAARSGDRAGTPGADDRSCSRCPRGLPIVLLAAAHQRGAMRSAPSILTTSPLM
jgi:hypothetical protein